MRVKVLMLLIAAIFAQDCLSHGLDNVSAVTDSDARYTGYRKAPPSPGQVKPLDAPMGSISPKSLTVGRAMKNLLAGTSYILAQGFTADPEIHVLLEARLPQRQRSLKNFSIKDALSIIAGDPWLMVIDPVNRMVSFELPYPYQNDPVITESKPHNGMQLLGFDDVETTSSESAPISRSNNCMNISRDMTVEWRKRSYWCYPTAYSKRDLCHD
jgi:hypothetical protein